MSSDELKVIGKALKKAKREKKAIIALRTNCPPDQTFSAHTLSFLREIGYNFDLANVRQRIDPTGVLASALLSREGTFAGGLGTRKIPQMMKTIVAITTPGTRTYRGDMKSWSVQSVYLLAYLIMQRGKD